MTDEGYKPGDRHAVPLPEWAQGLAEGDYTRSMASLPTRDGRVMGNATVIGPVNSLNPVPTYLVITDAGNCMKMTENEMKGRFYPPEFLQRQLLSTTLEAMREFEE